MEPLKGCQVPCLHFADHCSAPFVGCSAPGCSHAPLTLCLCFVAESFGQNYPEVRVQHCDFRNTALGFEWKMYLDPFFFFFNKY